MSLTRQMYNAEARLSPPQAIMIVRLVSRPHPHIEQAVRSLSANRRGASSDSCRLCRPPSVRASFAGRTERSASA
eukprot:2843479-Prymnesium_polylepis.2